MPFCITNFLLVYDFIKDYVFNIYLYRKLLGFNFSVKIMRLLLDRIINVVLPFENVSPSKAVATPGYIILGLGIDVGICGEFAIACCKCLLLSINCDKLNESEVLFK
jgi:hypothetical protein